MDEIDELVDWQMEKKPVGNKMPCPHCKFDWHGFRQADCPGSHVPVPDNPVNLIRDTRHYEPEHVTGWL